MKRYLQVPTRISYLLLVVMLSLTFVTSALAEGGSGKGAPIVENGNYDVWVFSMDMPNQISEVTSIIQHNFQNNVLQWTVDEVSGTNYVIAYPVAMTSEGIDARTAKTRYQIENILSGYGNACVYLNDWWFWTGPQWHACGAQGTKSYIYDLGVYNFDNKASSYSEALSISPGCKVYNYRNWHDYLGDLYTDTAILPSSMDNKITSLVITF